MKRFIAVLLALLAAGGAGTGGFFYLAGREGFGTDSARRGQDAVYVDSVAMLAGLDAAGGQIERFAGVVEPQDTWDLKLDSEMSVEETYVKVGDVVKQGDVLLKYSTTESEQKIAQDEIDLERSRNNIESDNQSIENLQKQLYAAQTEEDRLELQTQILQKQNDIKTTEYDIKTKELEIANLKEKIKNAEVLCELDGVVRSMKQESSASAYDDSGSEAYMTIMGTGDYRIKCSVNEQQISMIYVGEEMLVFSRVESGRTWTGTLTEIRTQDGSTGDSNSYYGSSSDSSLSSTSYPFYIQLDSSEDLILGQHVYVEQDFGQRAAADGLWLPGYYFSEEEDGTWVWAASGRNLLEKRTVVLGEYDENRMCWQVLEGLDRDDYIAAPDEEFREGLPVIRNELTPEGMDFSDMDSSPQEDFTDDDDIEEIVGLS